jgi:hypothetical protein
MYITAEQTFTLPEHLNVPYFLLGFLLSTVFGFPFFCPGVVVYNIKRILIKKLIISTKYMLVSKVLILLLLPGYESDSVVTECVTREH